MTNETASEELIDQYKTEILEYTLVHRKIDTLARSCHDINQDNCLKNLVRSQDYLEIINTANDHYEKWQASGIKDLPDRESISPIKETLMNIIDTIKRKLNDEKKRNENQQDSAPIITTQHQSPISISSPNYSMATAFSPTVIYVKPANQQTSPNTTQQPEPNDNQQSTSNIDKPLESNDQQQATTNLVQPPESHVQQQSTNTNQIHDIPQQFRPEFYNQPYFRVPFNMNQPTYNPQEFHIPQQPSNTNPMYNLPQQFQPVFHNQQNIGAQPFMIPPEVNNHQNFNHNLYHVQDRRNDENIMIKYQYLIPMFHGSFEEFPNFRSTFDELVHHIRIEPGRKLLILKSKLGEKPRGIIAGILDYHQAYLKLVNHYSSTFSLRSEISQKLEALPRVTNEWDLKTMTDNLVVVQEKYGILKMNKMNDAYLESEFMSIVGSKFPLEILRTSDHLADTGLRCEKYMADLRYYVERNQRIANIVKHEEIRSARRTNPTSLNLEMVNLNNPDRRYSYDGQYQNRNQNWQRYSPNRDRPNCIFCQQDHRSNQCRLSLRERKESLDRRNRCHKCLKYGHNAQTCRRPLKCFLCNGDHPASICENKNNTESTNVQSTAPPISRQTQPELNNINLPKKGLTKILITINKTECHALFDSGSTNCVMNTELQEKLKLVLEPESIPINQAAATGMAIGTVTTRVKIGIKSRQQKFYVLPGLRHLILGVDAMSIFSLIRDPHGNILQFIDSTFFKIPGEYLQNNETNAIQIDDTNRQACDEILKKHNEVFAQSKGEVGQIIGDYCYINLENNIPINQKAYRTSTIDQDKIDNQITDLLNRDLIERSTSNYSFPVVLVNKKDDGEKTRLCIDYRKLNSITIPERYPMPNIRDIEDKLLNAEFFSTLDISSGFHHIRVAPEDKTKTAFVTMHEHFQWKVMPFGLKNAPAIFQRIVYNILKRNNLTAFSHNYIDDIIIFSKTTDEHLRHIDQVLKVMKKENVKLKQSKCFFMKKSVTYIGHLISKNTIRPLNNNLSAITDYPPPHDKKTLRRFLGKINFYHRFIPDRTELLDPLYDLLKKEHQFKWSEDKQKSFVKIKEILTSELVIHIFDPNLNTIVITDASDIGIGAVLKQQKDNEEITIGYFSRKLLKHQKNYVVTEKECLAIIESIEYWHHYLYGRKFLIRTDHKPLKYINTHKKINTRIMNWAMRLNQYEFEIDYIKGETNLEADYLSRNPDFEINILSLGELEKIHEPLWATPPRGCVKHDRHLVKIRNGKMRYYLPEKHAIDEIKRIHIEKGHLGIVKTNKHFSTKYYSIGQNKIIQDIVNGCDICKKGKKQIRKYGEVGHFGPAEEPFAIIHIDTKGGFSEPPVKLRYFHLAIDAFSRYVWGITSSGQSAKDYKKLIDKICMDGKPKIVFTDKYASLTSQQFKDILAERGIELIHSPTAHPQSNGLIERVGQTLVERLRCKKLSDPNRSWSVLAKDVLNEYNTTIHSSTTFTPQYLLNGQDPDNLYIDRNLVNDRKIAFDKSEREHNKSKIRLEKKQYPVALNEGDYVYVDLSSDLNKERLEQRFQGPFKIVKKISNLMFDVQLPDHIQQIHVGKTKPAKAPNNEQIEM